MMHHRKGRQHDPGGFGPSILIFGLTILISLFVSQCAKAQTITHGGTYTTSSFFAIQTIEPVVMDHCTWYVGDGESPVIAACAGADLTIQNSMLVFVGKDPTTGQLFSVPNIWQFKLLRIHNCWFNANGQAGFYQQGGYVSTSAIIIICNNIFENCRVAIGLANVRDDRNIWIAWNQIASGPTNNWNDQISIYNSCGLIGSEIIVEHNYVQVDPTSPHVYLSGGLSLGDYGSFAVIGMGNICVNCSIGLWWSNNNTSKLIGNYVVGKGPSDVYSTGLMVFDNAGYAIGNTVTWLDTNSNQIHDYYLAPGIGQALNVDADPAIIPNPDQTMFWLWQSEYLAAHQTIGPQ